MKNVVVQGLGFVGSAMAVAIASKIDKEGDPVFNVTGIDLPNQFGLQRIKSINSGEFPFPTNDKQLALELTKAFQRGNLKATSNKTFFSKADVVMISINCDLILKDDIYEIDLDNFTDSIKDVAYNISANTLVIIESTIPPGTCNNIVYPLFQKVFQERGFDKTKIFLAHSYERVMPGDSYFDSIINYWRVYAGINDESSDMCEEFLCKVINTSDYPLTRLKNTIASESSKLLENSYRAVNIAFIEEWGRFAEDIGIDLFEVIEAIRKRPTHSNIRQPGFGVGGYCLTKDPLFAKIAARDIFKLHGHEFPFSSKAIKINALMPLVTLNKLKDYFNGNILDKRLLLMGATYRQDVGDTRFSPSELFYKKAEESGAKIDVHDPLIHHWEELNINVKKQLPDAVHYDAIVFAVPHKDFSAISMISWIGNHDILLVDANNVLQSKQIEDIKINNIKYISIGRG